MLTRLKENICLIVISLIKYKCIVVQPTSLRKDEIYKSYYATLLLRVANSL